VSTPSPLWDTKQLAAHLGVSPRYVGQLVKESRIPFTRLGRSLKFRPEEITTWVETRSRKAVS
jgi:excisionase family DNA binding protein